MDGFDFVTLIEAELKRQKMSKGDFYLNSGISSATMSQWRNRIYSPSSDAIRKVEKTLGVKFAIKQKEKPTLSGEQISEARKKVIDGLEDMTDEELLLLAARIKAIKDSRI